MEGTNLKLLNIGCGNKFHRGWVNIDMVSYDPAVISHNILNGFPFSDNQFDAVYHSQVLEHMPKERAASFIKECFRVMRPGGVLRVVLPDLENIVDEYKRNLELCLTQKEEVSEANYDWMVLEMFDQMVRSSPGGNMAKYFDKPKLTNEKFVLDRIGYVGKSLMKHYSDKRDGAMSQNGEQATKPLFSRIIKNLNLVGIKRLLAYSLLTKDEQLALRMGKFRNGGEVHYWMYDRFSLSRLLISIGFVAPIVKTPHISAIPNWSVYELDVKDGKVYDPTSLFMEAYKPATQN